MLEYIDLGGIDGYTMTALFEVLAHSVSRGSRGDTLVTAHPKSPFANVGFHQEVETEIDSEYCGRMGIPVVRRIIGGGAIVDGPWEQDYFVITGLGSPYVKGTIADYYKVMLEPVGETLRALGIAAQRSGLNDLAVSGRKISANGAVDIEGARVLTGDILLDLDLGLMTGVLKVPDEKFRDKLYHSMSEYLTSVKKELGHSVPRGKAVKLLIRSFSEFYGGLVKSRVTPEEEVQLNRLLSERKQKEWIFLKDYESRRLKEGAGRTVKIKENVFVCRADHKAEKLIRATLLVEEGRIADVTIAGDFFTVPVGVSLSQVERALAGCSLKESEISERVEGAVKECGMTLIGITPKDIVSVVLKCLDTPHLKVR